MKDAKSYRVSPNITSVLSLSKEGHKMFTGLQGQKILYTTSFVEKVCRKILVSIRAILLEYLG